MHGSINLKSSPKLMKAYVEANVNVIKANKCCQSKAIKQFFLGKQKTHVSNILVILGFIFILLPLSACDRISEPNNFVKVNKASRSFPKENNRPLVEYKYEPKDRCELEQLLANNNIKLDEINTKHITDFSLLFANPSALGKIIMERKSWMSTELVRALDNFQRCAGYDRSGDYAGIEFWDTSAAKNMLGMFWGASTFDHSIENWNTAQVETMERMFMGASSFNHPLNKWNVSKVKNMSNMFEGAQNFSQPLSNWKTDSVVTMNRMFMRASLFNQDISMWNTQNVTTMEKMFSMAVAFNAPIGKWNTQNVTNMASMFEKAVSFNQPLYNWQTKKVNNMSKMFKNAASFSEGVGSFDVEQVTDFSEMFYNAKNFKQDLNSWHINQYAKTKQAFHGAHAITKLPSWAQD